ncbi:hypothetical protein CCACVL1_29702 [Corchorus capsularis]|uniref:Uncharacterized protein n=1 Tax=Corchorus capsularis TaxID=210143 RepID=A0A1R3G0K2_COCAP|nr:hypothetical protein CCACVL1_29702 [Corchorus capsularis]
MSQTVRILRGFESVHQDTHKNVGPTVFIVSKLEVICSDL